MKQAALLYAPDGENPGDTGTDEECDGEDNDGDGVCDGDEIEGCFDETACNYNPDVTDVNNDLCEYAEQYYDCNGDCVNDADGDGVCDELEVAGCTNAIACNYDEMATDDDGSCTFAEDFYDCDGNCLNDEDMDGVCDELEVVGCTSALACNYNVSATDDDASCVLPEGCESCSGAQDGTGTILANDDDGDGVCNTNEVAGCQDSTACNYNAAATDKPAMIIRLR